MRGQRTKVSPSNVKLGWSEWSMGHRGALKPENNDQPFHKGGLGHFSIIFKEFSQSQKILDIWSILRAPFNISNDVDILCKSLILRPPFMDGLIIEITNCCSWFCVAKAIILKGGPFARPPPLLSLRVRTKVIYILSIISNIQINLIFLLFFLTKEAERMPEKNMWSNFSCLLKKHDIRIESHCNAEEHTLPRSCVSAKLHYLGRVLEIGQ